MVGFLSCDALRTNLNSDKFSGVRSTESLLASAIGSGFVLRQSFRDPHQPRFLFRSAIKRIILLSPTATITSTPTVGRAFTEEDRSGVTAERAKELGKDVPVGWANHDASMSLAERGKLACVSSRRPFRVCQG